MKTSALGKNEKQSPPPLTQKRGRGFQDSLELKTYKNKRMFSGYFSNVRIGTSSYC